MAVEEESPWGWEALVEECTVNEQKRLYSIGEGASHLQVQEKTVKLQMIRREERPGRISSLFPSRPPHFMR